AETETVQVKWKKVKYVITCPPKKICFPRLCLKKKPGIMTRALTYISYSEAITAPWTHIPSLLVFCCGCGVFLLIQEWGKSIGRSYLQQQPTTTTTTNGSKGKVLLKSKEKEDNEMEQIDKFGNVMMSLAHACMTSMASIPYVLSPAPTVPLASNGTLQLSFGLTMFYKLACNLSQAYFLMDLLSYVRKYFHLSENRVMTIHHLCGFFSVCPGALLLYENIPYEGLFISCACYALEFSTIFLNARYISLFFKNTTGYFWSGVALIISYPLTRILWFAYTIYYTYNSTLEITYCGPLKNVALFAETFVFFMSLGYFIVLLKAGKRLFVLDLHHDKPLKEVEKNNRKNT
ncbi:hypothetical protein RFI_12158, partial [Reticulomyxa filosa]